MSQKHWSVKKQTFVLHSLSSASLNFRLLFTIAFGVISDKVECRELFDLTSSIYFYNKKCQVI